jgi:hypothetical protein
MLKYLNSNFQKKNLRLAETSVIIVMLCHTKDADMRILNLGSGGAILDLDWFLKYHDIK